MVSACLPSLRPLFVRVVWGDARRPKPEQDDYFNSPKSLTSIWRSGSNTHDRSFNRLHDSGKGVPGSWTNNVAVYGGKGAQGAEEEILELNGPQEEEIETPMNRIRAKTTVVLTVSERVDWQDDLFWWTYNDLRLDGRNSLFEFVSFELITLFSSDSPIPVYSSLSATPDYVD